MQVQSEKKERDILKLLPPPKRPPKLTSRRIGIHTSTAGGVERGRACLPAGLQRLSDFLLQPAAMEAVRAGADAVR